jgi:hypothetical protein
MRIQKLKLFFFFFFFFFFSPSPPRCCSFCLTTENCGFCAQMDFSKPSHVRQHTKPKVHEFYVLSKNRPFLKNFFFQRLRLQLHAWPTLHARHRTHVHGGFQLDTAQRHAFARTQHGQRSRVPRPVSVVRFGQLSVSHQLRCCHAGVDAHYGLSQDQQPAWFHVVRAARWFRHRAVHCHLLGLAQLSVL